MTPFTRASLTGLAAAVLTLIVGAAHADPLGLYLGAGVGQANVRVDELPGVASSLRENHSAWNVVVGLRPISLLGAEVGYADLGRVSHSLAGNVATADVRTRASTLLGVLYLPLPIPLVDIYVKGGIARLQQAVTVASYCPPNVACLPVVGGTSASTSNDGTNVAYAAGAQVKLGPVAIRGEYLQIRASTGDPSLATLGVIWSF